MRKNFYVYAYIRAKDSNVARAGTPYYIGKGTGTRAYDKHTVRIPNERSRIVFLREGITDNEAIDLEIALIKEHGRIDINTGILRNKTNGGDGVSGRIVNESQRLKSSISNRGQKRSEVAKANIRRGLSNVDLSGEHNHFFGKTHTNDTKSKMSSAKKGRTWEEIFGIDGAAKKREELRIMHTGKTRTKEAIDKMKKPRSRATCPHCNVLTAWKTRHFDNCPSFSSEDG